MDTVDKTPIEQLRDIMRRLRDPESGCPWDVQQSFSSIAPYTLEEAYEVVDAIERNDLSDLQDELGDLLLQVVFHAQMASEQSLFDFDDVVAAIVDKMIRRHPHVFSDTVYANEAELKAAWEASKQAEKKLRLERKYGKDQTGTTTRPSILSGMVKNLPALKYADKLQTKAARAGFDWADIDPVWDKLEEEVQEVKEALQQQDDDAVESEIGDLLFTVVNLARHAGVDAESALRRSSSKFTRRFKEVENLIEQDKRRLSELELEEMDQYWEQSKLAESANSQH